MHEKCLLAVKTQNPSLITLISGQNISLHIIKDTSPLKVTFQSYIVTF